MGFSFKIAGEFNKFSEKNDLENLKAMIIFRMLKSSGCYSFKKYLNE